MTLTTDYMVINERLNSTKDYARHIYMHHYMCYIEEMNQTLIASKQKGSDLR
jgi:hypothetical protein